MHVTIFQNLEANYGKTIDIAFKDLPEFLTARNDSADSKEALPLFVASEFGSTKTSRGSLRHDKNVTSVTALIFDYDVGHVSIEKAAIAFQMEQISAVIAPTASWTKDKPKFRVVVPIVPLHGTPEELKAERKALIDEIAHRTGIAFSTETKTLSQSYYYGLPRSMAGEAKPVTVGNGGEFTPKAGPFAGREGPKPTRDRPTQGVDHPGTRRTHIDDAEMGRLEAILETGDGEVHSAMLSLSMALMNRGMPGRSVAKYIKVLMLSWRSEDARWQSRFADIDRIVDGAIRKAEQDKWDKDDEPLPEDHGVVAPEMSYVRKVLSGKIVIPPPPMVVKGYLPMGKAGGFVAPGGTGKSTLLLYESIHILLGLPLYGLEVERPGPVVYFSAEDDTDLVLQRLAKIAHAMHLSPFECEKVAAGFTVLPVLMATPEYQLVIDDMGNCKPTKWVDWSIEQIRSRGAVVAVMDPVSLIGPGERSMNDGMARLMKVGNRIGLEANCAVRYVHHETKSTEKRFDQYSGRGGAAFADNARSMVQMISLRGHRDEEFTLHGVRYLVPPSLGANEDDYLSGRVVGLLRHKLTAEELDVTPIFILRRGFEYRTEMGIAEVTDEGRAIANERDAIREAANTEHISENILQAFRALGPGAYFLQEIYDVTPAPKGQKAGFKDRLEAMVDMGFLEAVPGQRANQVRYRVAPT